MLRLPTVINFPIMLWRNKKQRRIDEEEITSLLASEETLIKHHGSIISVPDEDLILVQDTPKKKEIHHYTKNQVQNELIAILRFAIPLVITFLLGVGTKVVDVWFLGKVGPEGITAKNLQMYKFAFFMQTLINPDYYFSHGSC